MKNIINRMTKAIKPFNSISIRSWMVWLVVGLFAAVVIILGIQQFRLWRYNSLLKASKIRIEELDSRVQSARLEGMREAAKKQRMLNHKEVKEIDSKIEDYKKKNAALKKKIDRMKPTDLLREFKEEGF